MSANLQAGRERHLREKEFFEKLGVLVSDDLRMRVRREGILASITHRSKDTASLLKKMLRKDHQYDRVTDKTGVRVVLRYRNEVDIVSKIVEEAYEIIKREDKAEILGLSDVSYRGVHYDVRPRPVPEDIAKAIGIENATCEIQLHTLCQSLWAQIGHELAYKPPIPVPQELSREIYLLNALLEVADRSFSRIRDTVRGLPGAEAMEMVHHLEKHFYKYAGVAFDPELSAQVTEFLIKCYPESSCDTLKAFVDVFVEENESKLSAVFGMYSRVEDAPLFLFQPEGFLLLERLVRDPHVLEEFWTTRFPHDELAHLAVAWGSPLT